MNSILLLLCAALCLASCANNHSTNTKTNDVASDLHNLVNPIASEKSASSALSRWDRTHQKNDLIQANQIYKKLYQQRPDDINFQQHYYYSSILLTALKQGQTQAAMHFS